jgi:glycosyltransferase involved in cell wall biosynthesis
MTEERSKRRLRICLVGPAYPYRGGISHYNTTLAKELSKRHEVHIVNYSRLYPEFLFPGKTQLDESESAFSYPSRRIIDSVNPFTWVYAGFYLAHLKPDVTIFQWWHPYFAPALSKIGLILKFLRRGKNIFICHNVVPHERSPVDRMLSHIAFTAAHAFLVQSTEDRENLLRMKRRALVGYHPLPIFDFFRKGGLARGEARRRVGSEEDRPLLLFFGYIRAYKGLRHLIEAMKLIVEDLDARLLVVGEFYEERESYYSLVSELGLGDRIRFVDRYVDNDEVEAFFIASDLVVLPYITATQSGIVQIAFSFDRPVVVTDVGGLPEVVSEGKTGFVVPAGNPPAIADAVVRFFREGWAERMAPCFPEEKERFSWGSLAETLGNLITRVRGGDAR